MRLYHTKDEYIDFLRKYDEKVAINKKESRPYVGVVLLVDGIKYYAPLTSPKAKHREMKNSKDFRKIDQGRLGAINFNNMIPVPDSALMMIDINKEADARYKRLLQNQYRALKVDLNAIEKTARDLRTLILTPDSELRDYERQVKSRCCNLSLLESVYMKYEECQKVLIMES